MHYSSLNFLLLILFIQAFLAYCCIEHERDALLEFKAGVNDTSSRLASWSGDKCCNWAGIHCNDQTGHVVKLNLRNINYLNIYGDYSFDDWIYHSLVGKISPSLIFLSDLKYLDLSWNNFNGSKFPEFIGTFRNLKYLNLSYTGLSGMIPPQLGNLSRLMYFDVSNGYPFFSFMLKTDTWWLPNLSYLKHMDMSGVDFKDSNDWVESLNKLSSLEVLVLSENNLTNIPQSIPFVNFTSLIVLYLTDQNFNTTIPNWVGSLHSLDVLILEHCKLVGPYPATLGNLTSLNVLTLSDNLLVGMVPPLHGLTKLTDLSLWGNNIEGDIRELLLGKLSKYTLGNLEYLDLSLTNLSGTLTGWITDMTSVTHLDLDNNNLSGTIPIDIGNLTNLVYLDLSYNSLTGLLSETHLTSLYVLDLSSNSLSGHIPSCWSNISHNINLANNRLFGVLPRSLSCSITLIEVQLANNSLTGEFPSDLQFCIGLQLLDLGENNFHGIIPDWVGESFQQLRILSLQSNLFSGNIPSKLTQLNNLHFLDLSNNYLSGLLPRGLDNITSMSRLFPMKIYYYYSGRVNTFTKGLILEYDYRGLSFLKSMDLSNNNLTGDIPQEIVVLDGLLNLNLSHNHLIGNIPFEIGNMSSLESLDFHKNNLSGTIPQSISTLYSLEVLNFSYNNLSGSIPNGYQLQTLNDPSIYSGNPYLCGPFLGTSCDSSVRLPQSDDNNDSNSKITDDRGKWLYLFIEFGFVAVFLLVFFILLFKVKWRYTYFQMVDSMLERVYVMDVIMWKTKEIGS
ncbi:uncharacterized protein LOC144569647 [Carex rostrata]